MWNERIHSEFSRRAEVAFPDTIDEPRLPVYDSLQARDVITPNLKF